jgi:H+-translocating NAD(P) transhydrogenase subunit alpha
MARAVASGPLSHGERVGVRGGAASGRHRGASPVLRTPSPPPSPHGRGSVSRSWQRLDFASEGWAQPFTPARLARRVALLAAAFCLAPSAAWAAEAGGVVDPFVFRLSVFVLAIFVGYYVVWSVTPALHTPLMSVTNAISSVIVVGALLAVGVEHMAGDMPGSIDAGIASKLFGLLALAMASVNIFGGFLVTQRMLAMYKKKEKK